MALDERQLGAPPAEQDWVSPMSGIRTDKADPDTRAFQVVESIDPYGEQPPDEVLQLALAKIEQQDAQLAEQLRLSQIAQEELTIRRERKAIISEIKERTDPEFRGHGLKIIAKTGLEETDLTNAAVWPDPYRGSYVSDETWLAVAEGEEIPFGGYVFRRASEGYSLTNWMDREIGLPAEDDFQEDIELFTQWYTDDHGDERETLSVFKPIREERPSFSIQCHSSNTEPSGFRNVSIDYRPAALSSDNDPNKPKYHVAYHPDGSINYITGRVLTSDGTAREAIAYFSGDTEVYTPEEQQERLSRLIQGIKEDFGVELHQTPPEGSNLDLKQTILDIVERASRDPQAMPEIKFKSAE